MAVSGQLKKINSAFETKQEPFERENSGASKNPCLVRR